MKLQDGRTPRVTQNSGRGEQLVSSPRVLTTILGDDDGHRRAEATRAARLSKIEVDAIAKLANRIPPYRYVTEYDLADRPHPPDSEDHDAIAKYQAEMEQFNQRVKQQQQELDVEIEHATDELRDELTNRLAEAYLRGADAVSDRERLSGIRSRSTVLLLVVLAVVSMPIIAMVLGLPPETFGAYIAPVTAIAGTVVGYWFGAADRGVTAR